MNSDWSNKSITVTQYMKIFSAEQHLLDLKFKIFAESQKHTAAKYSTIWNSKSIYVPNETALKNAYGIYRVEVQKIQFTAKKISQFNIAISPIYCCWESIFHLFVLLLSINPIFSFRICNAL